MLALLLFRPCSSQDYYYPLLVARDTLEALASFLNWTRAPRPESRPKHVRTRVLGAAERGKGSNGQQQITITSRRELEGLCLDPLHRTQLRSPPTRHAYDDTVSWIAASGSNSAFSSRPTSLVTLVPSITTAVLRVCSDLATTVAQAILVLKLGPAPNSFTTRHRVSSLHLFDLREGAHSRGFRSFIANAFPVYLTDPTLPGSGLPSDLLTLHF